MVTWRTRWARKSGNSFVCQTKLSTTVLYLDHHNLFILCNPSVFVWQILNSKIFDYLENKKVLIYEQISLLTSEAPFSFSIKSESSKLLNLCEIDNIYVQYTLFINKNKCCTIYTENTGFVMPWKPWCWKPPEVYITNLQ